MLRIGDNLGYFLIFRGVGAAVSFMEGTGYLVDLGVVQM